MGCDSEKILLSAWSHPLFTKLTNPHLPSTGTAVQSDLLPDWHGPTQLELDLIKEEVVVMTEEEQEEDNEAVIGQSPPPAEEVASSGSSAVGGAGGAKERSDSSFIDYSHDRFPTDYAVQVLLISKLMSCLFGPTGGRVELHVGIYHRRTAAASLNKTGVASYFKAVNGLESTLGSSTPSIISF